jgi:xanthine permease XanP
MNNKSTIIYGPDENPPVLMTFFLALEHLLLYMPGTIMTPLIIANILVLPNETKEILVFSSLLASGISSFIQIKRVGRIGSGYMLFMGPSGAYFSCSIAAGLMGGFGLIASLTILTAPLELIAAHFLRYVRKIITPMMGGIVIILIVIDAIPVLMTMWTGQPGSVNYSSPGRLISGIATIVIIIVSYLYGKTSVRIWSPLLGMAGGTIVAYFTGTTDFSLIASYDLIGLPSGKWIFPDFNLNFSHIPIFMSFLFVTLASTIETLGDGIMIQEVSKKDMKKVNYETVQGTLLGDGVGKLIGGLFGNLANTTYSGNVAVIKLTGVASRRVGYTAAAILMILAFFPRIIVTLTMVPSSVIGASTLAMLGMLFASGVKLIASSELDHSKGLIVGVSLTLGIISGFKLFFPPLLPEAIKPFLENGVATGGLCAILLSLLVRLKTGRVKFTRLEYKISELTKLQKFINKFVSDQNLSEEQSTQLHLASEEIFAYICTKNPHKEGWIKFNFSITENQILTTVEDKSDIKDVDLIDKTSSPMEIDTEELGLMILNKIVTDLEHIQINEYNSITFKI